MKKKFIMLFVCLFSFSIFFFSACNEPNYSKEDVENLYQSIMTDYGLDNYMLDVSIDMDKVVGEGEDETLDKSYIFSRCYSPYVISSSGLIFGVAARQERPTLVYAIQSFNQEEINSVYNGLNKVKLALDAFKKAKTVFENSGGKLYYQETINSLNDLINNLYNLNDDFSKYYFSYYYTDFKNETELHDGSLKDFLWYELCSISKVSFKYEMENFVPSNPYGEINAWFNSTVVLGDFVNSSSQIIEVLNRTNLVGGLTSSEVSTILNALKSVQAEMTSYEHEYDLYLEALGNINLLEYFNATNKNAYINSCSMLEKSSFNIIDNFISGRYAGFIEAMDKILINLS